MRPVKTLLLAATLAGAAVPVLAQGGAPPGGGGFNRAAFTKFREQHKYTFQLSTTTGRGLMECERTPQTRIKPDQAKKILGVLAPLKKKPKLTQDEAKAAIKKLQVIFDGKQLSAVDKAIQASAPRPGGGGPGGPGGGPGGGGPGGGGPGGGAPGGGGPGGAPGGGGAGGARPSFDPAKAKDFNPYNPQPGSPRYESRLESNKKLFAFLDARAAGKDAKLDLPTFGRPGGPGGPGGAPGAPGGRPGGNPR